MIECCAVLVQLKHSYQAPPLTNCVCYDNIAELTAESVKRRSGVCLSRESLSVASLSKEK